MFMVNDEKLTVVDRQRMETLRQEMDFQLSGDVDDEYALSIGKRLGAQTIISGAINPAGDIYRLRVQAVSVETGVILAAQNYSIAIDSVMAGLAGITAPEPPPPKPSNRRLALGLRAGVSPHFFTLSDEISGSADNPSASFEPAFHAAFFLTRRFALQTELALSRDKLAYSGDDGSIAYNASFESFSLQIPLLARFTFNPGIFSISGFAGICFNIPLGKMKHSSSLYDESSYRFSPPPGYTAGTSLGVRAGPGFLFLDIRFNGSFAKTSIHDSYGTMALYARNALSFSLGYEFEVRRK